jgi:hypothetical protein
MKRSAMLVVAVTSACLVAAPAAWAGPSWTRGTGAQIELARAVEHSKVSLQQGLAASEREGKPIWAEYALHDGQPQLYVRTVKGDQFEEVIVDRQTGQIARVEPIEGIKRVLDLEAAKSERAAMDMAKKSLQAAVDEAAHGDKRARAVKVVPTMRDGHPVADVTLARGDEFKTVSERLD